MSHVFIRVLRLQFRFFRLSHVRCDAINAYVIMTDVPEKQVLFQKWFLIRFSTVLVSISM